MTLVKRRGDNEQRVAGMLNHIANAIARELEDLRLAIETLERADGMTDKEIEEWKSPDDAVEEAYHVNFRYIQLSFEQARRDKAARESLNNRTTKRARKD